MSQDHAIWPKRYMSDLFKDSDTYQIYISCKYGWYDIYIVESSTISQFSIPQQSNYYYTISGLTNQQSPQNDWK